MSSNAESVEVARELVSLLQQVKKASLTHDEVQRLKTLNAALYPAYMRLMGRAPLIDTHHPHFVWWPRAYQHATDILAALEAGIVRDEPNEERPAPLTSSQANAVEAAAAPLSRTVFVIGPIGNKFAHPGSADRLVYEEAIEVLEHVIEPACTLAGLPKPLRADQIAQPGEIPEQVFQLLRDAEVVIGDVTGGNPNVMYELGLRHTKPYLTVQLGENGKIPFDISVVRTILFTRSEHGLIQARDQLVQTLSEGLSGNYLPVTATRVWQGGDAIGEVQERPSRDEVTLAEELDDEPGFADLLLELEEASPLIVEAVERIGEATVQMGELMERAVEQLARADANNEGMAGRLRVATQLAGWLKQPVDTIENNVAKYEQTLRRVDPGVRWLLAHETEDPEEREPLSEFQATVIEMAEKTREGVEGAQYLAETVNSFGGISRVLRPIGQRLSAALVRFVEASAVIYEWEQAARERDV